MWKKNKEVNLGLAYIGAPTVRKASAIKKTAYATKVVVKGGVHAASSVTRGVIRKTRNGIEWVNTFFWALGIVIAGALAFSAWDIAYVTKFKLYPFEFIFVDEVRLEAEMKLLTGYKEIKGK